MRLQTIQSQNSDDKKHFNWWFIHWHKIDLGEYRRENKDDYLTFNDFFTREIKPELRPTEGPINAVVSPVDGGCIRIWQN